MTCDNRFERLGPITWRTFNPGVELSPVNRVEIFCDYMDDFNPGVETLYYTFSASIPRNKKAFKALFQPRAEFNPGVEISTLLAGAGLKFQPRG